LTKVWDRQNPPPAAPLLTFGYVGSSSLIATVTDANGHVAVQNFYDTANRVAEQHDATGAIMCLCYGTAPRYSSTGCPAISPAPTQGQTVQVDPVGNKTTFSYDSASRKTQVQDALGGLERFAYDTEGNITSATDPKTNTTNFCYDLDYTGAGISGSRGNLTRTISPPPSTGANPLVTLRRQACTPSGT